MLFGLSYEPKNMGQIKCKVILSGHVKYKNGIPLQQWNDRIYALRALFVNMYAKVQTMYNCCSECLALI